MLAITTPTNAIELWRACCDVEIPAGTSPATIRELDTRQTSSLVSNDGGKVDKTECYKLIKLAIIDIAEFFGGKFSDVQLAEMSKILYNKFYYWRLLDWANFKNNVCGLSYGKVYGQISAGQVIEFANIYDTNWLASAESESGHEHDRIKKETEKERNFEQLVKEKAEARIHESAVEHFKNSVKLESK